MMSDEQVNKIAGAIKQAGSNISFLALAVFLGCVCMQCNIGIQMAENTRAINNLARANERIATEIHNKQFYDEDLAAGVYSIPRELSQTFRETLPVTNSLTECFQDQECDVEGERCVHYPRQNFGVCRRTTDSLLNLGE